MLAMNLCTSDSIGGDIVITDKGFEIHFPNYLSCITCNALSIYSGFDFLPIKCEQAVIRYQGKDRADRVYRGLQICNGQTSISLFLFNL